MVLEDIDAELRQKNLRSWEAVSRNLLIARSYVEENCYESDRFHESGQQREALELGRHLTHEVEYPMRTSVVSPIKNATNTNWGVVYAPSVPELVALQDNASGGPRLKEQIERYGQRGREISDPKNGKPNEAVPRNHFLPDQIDRETFFYLSSLRTSSFSEVIVDLRKTNIVGVFNICRESGREGYVFYNAVREFALAAGLPFFIFPFPEIYRFLKEVYRRLGKTFDDSNEVVLSEMQRLFSLKEFKSDERLRDIFELGWVEEDGYVFPPEAAWRFYRHEKSSKGYGLALLKDWLNRTPPNATNTW